MLWPALALRTQAWSRASGRNPRWIVPPSSKGGGHAGKDGASGAALQPRGEQAAPTVPADVAELLQAHRLDPADPALARCVVTALGVSDLAVRAPPTQRPTPRSPHPTSTVTHRGTPRAPHSPQCFKFPLG